MRDIRHRFTTEVDMTWEKFQEEVWKRWLSSGNKVPVHFDVLDKRTSTKLNFSEWELYNLDISLSDEYVQFDKDLEVVEMYEVYLHRDTPNVRPTNSSCLRAKFFEKEKCDLFSKIVQDILLGY